MKIYPAGKISGDSEYKTKFRSAAGNMRLEGFG